MAEAPHAGKSPRCRPQGGDWPLGTPGRIATPTDRQLAGVLGTAHHPQDSCASTLLAPGDSAACRPIGACGRCIASRGCEPSPPIGSACTPQFLTLGPGGANGGTKWVPIVARGVSILMPPSAPSVAQPESLRGLHTKQRTVRQVRRSGEQCNPQSNSEGQGIHAVDGEAGDIRPVAVRSAHTVPYWPPVLSWGSRSVSAR